MATPIASVLSKLEAVRREGHGWSARCPAHEDDDPSLSVSEGEEGRVLMYCHAGCRTDDVVAELGLELRDLFPEGGEGGQAPSSGATAPLGGCSLADYADAKGLPIEFLRELGLTDLFISSAPAVNIPYRDESGQEIAVRFRTSLDGGDRFRWRKGSKALPYGLWRLDEARSAGAITIVEGESDAQTLWLHDIPALGVPGASTWRSEWAACLDGIQRIDVVIEPDAGGAAVLDWLGRSSFRDRVRLIRLEGVKDPSELYLGAVSDFTERWARAVAAAQPWTDEAAAAAARTGAEALVQAAGLEVTSDILSAFAADIRASRLVAGEERALKLVYLAVTSRLLDHPVSLALKGPSAGGKSYIVERVLDYFPDRAYYAMTGMSERALAYDDEPLEHRVLVIYEAAGLSGEMASYLVRSLLSEGHLRYVTVEKTADGLRPRTIDRPGPTGLIVTTTAIALHPENETRLLSLPVTDTPAQTKSVMLSLAEGAQEGRDLTRWQALQTWLSTAEPRVVLPFATALAHLVPPVSVRMRRDFRAVLELVRAHTLLHQATRTRNEAGAVIGTIEDYGAVRELVVDLIAEAADAAVPEAVREAVAAVERLGGHRPAGDRADDAGVTAVALGRELGLDKSAARRRALGAIERGFLTNLEARRGRPMRLVVGEPLPDEVEILPAAAELTAAVGGTVAGEQPEPDLSLPPDTGSDDIVAIAREIFGDDLVEPDLA